MPLIKLTNKSFLREHPFVNPIDAPFPVQAHSFIFPGDELVMYHKISLPTDASTPLMNDIKFISAKVSVIAQKPNVFSEEFSREFTATRNFELDSFITSFNNINARVIPWGTDGYAPNLTVKQDRNFLLPSADFRREVNFFTKHTAGTAIWDYWFYFPILFRWEYWISLLNADNDFYDASLPQDGLNNWWYRYFNDVILPFGWKIKSRLDLTVLINGVSNVIRAELDLTPNAGDVNDYNSNADYTQKSIKTSKVGGTLSNTPCFVNGNENTIVVGALRHVLPWEVDEQANIGGLNWIEPFEGAGVTARTRGSSYYQITPESVFMGLGLSATDDDNIGITNEAGLFVVYNPSGTGALTLFESGTPEVIKVVSIIDYNKLKLVYPGVTKFTLYTRIYNSLDVNPLADPALLKSRKGEEIKQDAIYITGVSQQTICSQRPPQCPFVLNVYGDAIDSSEIKNDKSDFYYYGDATVESIVMTLQKNDSACGDMAYADVKIINDNSIGKYFSFGTNPDFSGVSFIDDYGKKYTGVFVEWRKVLAAYGVGKYRMLITKTDVFGTITTAYDQREFCLHNYDCRIIDKTVKIEIYNQGLRGVFGEDAQVDYAGGWKGEIRLKGLLKFKSSAYVKEYNQYGDSSFNALKPIVNEQQPKFQLAIRPIPGWMDWILSTNVLQADEILVTDYNLRNRQPFTKVPLMIDGDYTPRDSNLGNAHADVEIEMAFGRNNLRKRNSQ